ncbi:hypothetical protein I5S53_04430 [Pseudomonas juntendi]|uniref:hypothetical protein n=1 Tax=Pseudomonas TaxID=286 RepID=UPI0005C72899|nr:MULTISPECIES: hypothetical protein [Pseudomonas]MBH3383223.1 hypothetical protein [Pseudomonas juntendi]
MKINSKTKSSPSNRINQIIEGLLKASDKANKNAQLPLARMPEYFMAVHVAEHFANEFANFGYHLEASVKQTLSDAGVDESEIEDLLQDENLRGNGRFDLVIRTGKKNLPAHILEFKRGARSAHLLKDFERLAYVSKIAHDGEKLKTNYMVFTTKRPESKIVAMLDAQAEARKTNQPRARNKVAYALKAYEPISHWAKGDKTRKPLDMAIAVVEIKYTQTISKRH